MSTAFDPRHAWGPAWLGVPGVIRRADLLAVLIEYEGGLKCAICNRRIAVTKTGGEQLTIDHIIPFGFGGGHCLVNLQLTHRKCNEKKADTYTQEDIDKVGRRIEAVVAAKRGSLLVAAGVHCGA
jgi:5-methylcytosine-specific restriction endonuclease McrA